LKMLVPIDEMMAPLAHHAISGNSDPQF